MSKEIEIDEFLELSKIFPVIDVRSPGEYEHAHIPGALNLPLFSNEERAEVGTIYKKRGRVNAVMRGLEIVGPKLKTFSKQALALNSPNLLIHCWRGGMRSSSMAWLLETVGLSCSILKGGYKSYRAHTLNSLSQPLNIILLGGYTGSGKTDLLKLLEESGQQVIDLEGMANHKGSAFGALGQPAQPSTEMFENMLFHKITALNKSAAVWVEDESHNVGKVFIPEPFWRVMRQSPLVVVNTPFNTRLERLMRDYGCYSQEMLVASIKKIEKRLGYDKCKLALDSCLKGEIKQAAEICLLYYDKAYGNQLETRYGELLKEMPQIGFIPGSEEETVALLKNIAQKYERERFKQ